MKTTQKKTRIHGAATAAAGVILAAFTTACVDGDNPTALSELNPVAEFEIEGTVETFREVEINVDVTEGGARMQMSAARMHVESPSGSRTVDMEEDEHGLGAHITFYEEGLHHVEMMGTPNRHSMEMDMGDIEIMVTRYHEVAGPYWVEFGTDPAPISKGQTGHLEIFVYALQPDSSRGALVPGLTIVGEIHHPDGDESVVPVEDTGTGEYEAEFDFVEAGMYELHAEIDDGTGEFTAEFHFPVIDPDAGNDTPTDDGNGGGHHHG